MSGYEAPNPSHPRRQARVIQPEAVQNQILKLDAPAFDDHLGCTREEGLGLVVEFLQLGHRDVTVGRSEFMLERGGDTGGPGCRAAIFQFLSVS